MRKKKKASLVRGAGVGLRPLHIDEVLETLPSVPYFEVLIDNFMDEHGVPLEKLRAVREHYPLVFHSVGMNLGGTDALDSDYIARMKVLADELEPSFLSDHLCFTRLGSEYFHDLLPLPQNEEVIRHLASRIAEVEDRLEQRIAVENIARYVQAEESDLSEKDFLVGLLKEVESHFLFDLNNLYINSVRFGFDPTEVIRAIPEERIAQIHMAGFVEQKGELFDTHNRPVADPVRELLKVTFKFHGEKPTLLEWDSDIPSLQTLIEEANKNEPSTIPTAFESTPSQRAGVRAL